jgi:ATP-dependent Clp protease ATP-binding subunit ClpA
VLSRTDSPWAAVLGHHGLTHDAAAESITSFLGADLDAEALSTLGIDLDAVRDSVEASFGPGALEPPSQGSGCRDRRASGHLPFSPQAKKVLELALRESLALKQKTITDGHIALGLLREGEGLAMKVLHDRGIDPAELRRDLTAVLRS